MTETKKTLTWQQKVAKGLPLNWLEQVKADGFRVQTRRQRELEEELAAKEAPVVPLEDIVEAPAEPEQPAEVPEEPVVEPVSKKGK